MSSDGNHMTRFGDVKQEIQTWRLAVRKVKDSILKALKEEKYENLEAKLFELKVVSATFLLVRFFKCKREY